MSFRCILGRHKVSLATILSRRGRYVGLCESCARPLEREHKGPWMASRPLDLPRDHAA